MRPSRLVVILACLFAILPVPATAQSGSWTTKQPMPTARHQVQLAQVNGRIYAIGGDLGFGDSDQVEEYDPLMDSWLPKRSLSFARRAHAVAELDGKIYVIGGVTHNTGNVPLPTVEVYDPATNGPWQSVAPLPSGRQHPAAATYGGKIYVFASGVPGGGSDTRTVVYDPQTDQWSTRSNTSPIRHILTATTIGDKIYVTGIESACPNTVFDVGNCRSASPEKLFYAYDPATDTFSQRQEMNTARNFPAAATVNGRLHLMGGNLTPCCGPTETRATEEYDPATNMWVTRADMPTARYGLGAIGIFGKIYAIGGGASNNQIFAVNEQFDPMIPPGKLVFSRGAGATHNELWVVNDDGTGARQVLVRPGPVEVPRWSRDGRRISFISGDQLWVVNDDGTNLHLLNPHTSGVGLSWNAAGTGLLYGAFCTCCEYLRAIDADGSNDRLFFGGRAPIRNIDARPGDPNPDGLVAYRLTACGEENLPTTFFGIELTRSSGTDFSQVPGSAGVTRQILPRWSPDGSLLATAIRLGGNTGDWAIELLNPLNPSVPRTRILQAQGEFFGLDFGSGTHHLYFTRATDNFRNIQRVNSDGTGLVQVTTFGSGFIREVDHIISASGGVPGMGTLSIQVLDTNGGGLGGALVTPSTGPSQNTSGGGSVSFSLAEGVYDFSVTAAGNQAAGFSAGIQGGTVEPHSVTLVATGIGSSSVFSVSATASWQNGMNVNAGDRVIIYASGRWTANPQIGQYGPDGQIPAGNCGPAGNPNCPLLTARHGILTARIGSGPAFPVGSTADFVAPASGVLLFIINDDILGDNSGSLSVNIIHLQFGAVTDTDGDGIPDASDNCPLNANPLQEDSNGNGFGYPCDSGPRLTEITVPVAQPIEEKTEYNVAAYMDNPAGQCNIEGPPTYFAFGNVVVDPQGALYATVLASDQQHSVVRCSALSAGSIDVGIDLRPQHNWDWIEPLDLSDPVEVANILADFVSVLPGFPSTGVIAKLDEFRSLLLTGGSYVQTGLHIVPAAEYTYFPDPAVVEVGSLQPSKVRVEVSAVKKGLLASHYVTEFACLVIDFTPPLINFIAGIACQAVGIGTYIAAYDPQPDFTQIAEPVPLRPAQLSLLPPGPERDLATLYLDILSVQRAFTTSFARYQAARDTGEANWAYAQLRACENYQLTLTQLINSLPAVQSAALTPYLPLSISQIQSVQSELSTNGYPQDAAAFAAAIGVSPNELEAMRRMTSSVDPSLFAITADEQDALLSMLRTQAGQNLQNLQSELPQSPPPDGDGDGIPDAIDNCSGAANFLQKDFDKDGIGDACDPNNTPVANAGANQTMAATKAAGADIQLDGTASIDPDAGDALAFTWTGPFGTAMGPTPTVTLPLGTHTITLTVDDGRGGVASDTVQITVTPPVCSTLTAYPKNSLVQLSWTLMAAGADHYDVYRSTTNGGPYAKIGTATGTQTLFYDRAVTNGTTYYYVLRPAAVNNTEICQSNQVTATPRSLR